MQRRVVLLGAASAILQVVVNGVLLFFLYRFLYGALGVAKLGLWSLVMATTSLSNLANLGLSASVVKFVAKHMARGEEEKASLVIQTSTLSLGAFFAALSLAAFLLINWILHLVLPAASIADGRALVPFSLASMWLIVVSGVFQSGMDGHQKVYLRNYLLIAAMVLNFSACLLLVPRYGLMGVAYAQVFQSGLMLVASWVVLKKLMPLLPLVPWRWDRKLFAEMVAYGVNFQVITVSTMLYDPLTKSLLAKFGGLATTGYYEMASRLTQQVRALIINANQVLVPTIANLLEKDPGSIRKVYVDSYKLILFTSFPVFSALAALTPVISKLWTGQYEPDYIFLAILLAVGWQLNTLAAPAYFVFAGVGILRWNTVSHVAIAVLNLGLGVLMGSFWGGQGVVAAWVVSLAVGSAIIPAAYHRREGIPLSCLLPRSEAALFAGCALGTVISLALFATMKSQLGTLALAGLVGVVLVASQGYFLWTSPTRRRLTGWVLQEFATLR